MTRALGTIAIACWLVACGESSGEAERVTDAATDAASDAATDAASDAASDAACLTGPERNGPYSLVNIVGNPGAKGAIDPSVVYPDGASLGLMTYTTVPDEAHDRIAIATSTNEGASWQYTADVTQATPITIATTDSEVCGAATCTGTFVHESSSLVSDPTDPDPSRRLKVFTHSYFFGSQRQLQLGYLAMYTAAAPEGPWSETKLFGWSSESPISTEGVAYDINTDTRIPEMHDCFIVGEPGALVREPDVLELALSCPVISGGGATIEVRLLRSLDHGVSWSFVATLLSPEDGMALGSTVPEINGSALLHANGGYHLIVTPTSNVDFPDGPGPGYRGCVVVPFLDIETGTIERCNGNPVVEVSYLGEPGQFVGACSADVGASANGMLIPVPDFSNPLVVDYRIYAAGLPLP